VPWARASTSHTMDTFTDFRDAVNALLALSDQDQRRYLEGRFSHGPGATAAGPLLLAWWVSSRPPGLGS
jgi:hypothetical protein